MLTVKQAQKNEKEQAVDFYYEMIDTLAPEDNVAQYHKDIYPNRDDIGGAIDSGDMFFGMQGDEIVAAMVVNDDICEGYDQVDWPSGAKPEEAAVIHLLSVMPRHGRKGYAVEMTKAALQIAAKRGKKVIWLDVVEGNIHAEKAYIKAGFNYVSTREVYYEDTGLIRCRMFECIL